jgi:2-octaprenyl-6-methoxyphenol hydroxylase
MGFCGLAQVRSPAFTRRMSLHALTPPAEAGSVPALRLVVVGAGPVGLALALRMATALPHAEIATVDARQASTDSARDTRTLALGWGSVMALQQLQAWPEQGVQPIERVHVSQWVPGQRHDPAVSLHAHEENTPMLGAVMPYGLLCQTLQERWLDLCAQQGPRLQAHWGLKVCAIKPAARGGVVWQAQDAASRSMEHAASLVLLAEGGGFDSPGTSGTPETPGSPGVQMAQPRSMVFSRSYGQTGWVGQVRLQQPQPFTAFERFTPQGPVALLPQGRDVAALVWCQGQAGTDPMAQSPQQRLKILQALLHEDVGPLQDVSELYGFPLGLRAHGRTVQGRVIRVGNAAQMLHPVAGQGLNLGLRDAFSLSYALQAWAASGPAGDEKLDAALRLWSLQRLPDRVSQVGATDLLARCFGWTWPGAAWGRGLGLRALAQSSHLRRALAGPMMFGWR